MTDLRAAFSVFGSSERVPLLPEEWEGWPQALRTTVVRLFIRALGLAFVVAAIGTAIALLTYQPSDPSWNNASDLPARNALGAWGANVADLLWQSFGYAAWTSVAAPLAWGVWLVDGRIGLKLVLRI